VKISKKAFKVFFIILAVIFLNNIRIYLFLLPNLKNEALCEEKIQERISGYPDVELDRIIDTRLIFFDHKAQIDQITGLTPTDYVRWFVAYKVDPVTGDRIKTQFATGIITSKLEVFVANYNGGFI